MASRKIQRFAFNPDGSIWFIADDSTIWRLWESSKKLEQLPGSGTDIGIGADGTVWVIGTNVVASGNGYGVFRWTGSDWQPVPGNGEGIRVAVDPHGIAWGINSSHKIFRFNGSTGFDPILGEGQEIAIGPQGHIWLIGTDATPGGFGIYVYRPIGWHKISGGAVSVAVGTNDQPLVVNAAGEAFARVGNPPWGHAWKKVADHVDRIAFRPDGRCAIMSSDPTINNVDFFMPCNMHVEFSLGFVEMLFEGFLTGRLDCTFDAAPDPVGPSGQGADVDVDDDDDDDDDGEFGTNN